MTELKRCPYCGNDAVIYNTNTVFVECKYCHASGPYMKTAQDAIAAWNAIPRSLRWKKEQPTEPGWYWFRNLSKPQIVHLNSVKNRKPHPADEWAGPIQEPVN